MISGTAGPMMSKALRLRLPNYTEEIATGFSKLLKAESMTDVTLICNGGQTIRAHQVILATFSPYFRAIFEAQPFTNNPCQYPVIVIKDLAYPELRAILEFIYRGEVSISRDKLPAVLQAAKALEISGLSDLRVESALNGVPTSSTSASSTAADSSDLMDSTLLASLTGAHHSHNSMAALNAVNNGPSMATSNGTGNKRPHESMMNCTSTSMFPGSLDSLKKARLALDQNGSMPMDRLGMGLLNENGLNNVAAYNRFGQNPFNLNRSLDRTIIELMQQQNQQLKRFSENNNRAMTVEQFLAQRQMRQQKMMQQRNQQQSPQTDSHSQSNGNNSKQQILQQHLMQKNSSISNNNNNNINNSISNNNGNSISKSPPTSSTSSSSDKPVATSPNCNSSPERLTNIKRDDSPKPASSSSPGADDGDRPEDMSKSKTTMTSSGDEARSIDPSSSSSCSDAEQSIGTGTGCNGEIDDKLDQESGQHDDAGDLGSNDMDSNNNNNSSSRSSGSHNGANNNTSDARNDDDERPLQLTIETNTSSDDGDKRSYGSDGKRTPKSPMTQDCGASHNGDHNGSVDDDLDQDGNSPVKQEIDIEEDPIMLNTNVDDMSEYMDQDDMNGESEDYDIQANKESESKFWLRQQQLRLAQLQRQQYNHLLQLQADQQEAKLIEFYEQLQQANTIGRFPQDPDVDPSTVISLDWKEGFMDDSCPDRSGLDSIHPLANSLAPINRSLVGLMSAQNGLIGRDLKNSPSSNLNGTSNGGTNNGQTGGTPLITPDFLQPRGPGRPRKGNKAQDISPCPECNKVFVRPDVLKLHYRSVHLNERHPCNLCPKIFKWPGDLSKHKRTKHPEALAAAAAAKAAI